MKEYRGEVEDWVSDAEDLFNRLFMIFLRTGLLLREQDDSAERPLLHIVGQREESLDEPE